LEHNSDNDIPTSIDEDEIAQSHEDTFEDVIMEFGNIIEQYYKLDKSMTIDELEEAFGYAIGYYTQRKSA